RLRDRRAVGRRGLHVHGPGDQVTVDAYASRPQYLQHILPVWRALSPAARGTLYRGDEKPLPRATPILVAASGDMAASGRKRVALMEHGAGLSYGGDMTSRGL